MEKVNKQLRNLILYFLFALVLVIMFKNKVDYHLDELLTYNLANDDSWLVPLDGVTYYPADQIYMEALTSDGNYALSDVWKQQANDTHPPVYYVLVHFICALFPHTFSMWYTASINIVFQLLTLFVIRKMVDLFTNNKFAKAIISLQYILCCGILSISSFLRMYVMMIFFVTLFAYVILKRMDKYTIYSFLPLILITVLGALTHYYFIIFAFFVSAYLVLMLLFQKRFREAILYTISMAISGGLSYLIFPAITMHLFKQQRGTESLEQLEKSDILEQCRFYYDTLNRDLFGGLINIILIVIAIALVYDFIMKDRDKEGIFSKGNIENKRYICLFIGIVGSFIVIAKSTPNNYNRYISPVYAVTMTFVMCLLFKVLSFALKKQKNVICLTVAICLACTIGSFINCKWDYLYKDNLIRLQNAGEVAPGSDAYVLYKAFWEVNPAYKEISLCQSSTFYNAKSYDEFAKNDIELSDCPTFFLVGVNAEKFSKAFAEEHPEYELILDNGAFGNITSLYYRRK